MNNYNDQYFDEEVEKLLKEARSPITREKWRRLATKSGMISSLGEYTPVEFVALLEYIDELETELKLWKGKELNG